jgi:hypothetical protein
LRFLREKEKTRVFAKDSRAEACRKSFPKRTKCSFFTGKNKPNMLKNTIMSQMLS